MSAVSSKTCFWVPPAAAWGAQLHMPAAAADTTHFLFWKVSPDPLHVPMRCVLQRWNHHLHPDIRKDAWTEGEEQQLVAAHRQLGNKWSDIARRLPGGCLWGVLGGVVCERGGGGRAQHRPSLPYMPTVMS